MKKKLGDGLLLGLRRGRDGRGGGEACRHCPPSNSGEDVVDLMRRSEFFLHGLVREESKGEERSVLL